MSDMYVVKMTITPEMATKFLETNPRNRRLKQETVRKLTNDILNGDWKLTHQGIAIDENGKLIDGQHRLTAIVKAGIACEMMVTFNAPETEKIDIGNPRNDRDALYMAGMLDKEALEYDKATFPLISFIVGRNLGAHIPKQITSTEKHRIYLKLKETIDPIISIVKSHRNIGTKNTGSAAISYAMLCAYSAGVPIEALSQWHYIVTTGDFYVEGNDIATRVGRSVISFVNHLNTINTRRLSGPVKNVTIKKAMSSISAYSEGRELNRLGGTLVYPEITITLEDLNGKSA